MADVDRRGGLRTIVASLLVTVRALLGRRVVADLALTFGARGGQVLLGLLGNVISARVLGPVEFGRFGLIMATVTIAGTLADAGLTYTAIAFIARHNASDPPQAQRYAQTYFWLRLATGAGGAGLGIGLAAPLAGGLLRDSQLTAYLQLAFGTLLGLGFSSYPGTVLVALGRFGRLASAGLANTAITLLGIVLLFAAARLDLATLVAWNVVLPLVSTLPAWLLVPAAWRRPWRHAAAGPPKAPIREMLRFSRWMGLSLLASILVAQGDLLLVGWLAGPAVVGVYSVALALASRLDTLNQSLFTVLMPRASRLAGATAMRRYQQQALRGGLLLAGGLGLVALLAQPAIVLLYGARYTEAAPIFLALLGVVLFDLATSALFLIAWPLGQPRVLALADWLRVGVLGAAGWALIPIYGAFGAVGARFLARLTGTVATLWTLRRALGRLPADPSSEF